MVRVLLPSGGLVQVATVRRQTRPEYQAEYWGKRKGARYNAGRRASWAARFGGPPEFIAVDSEGITTESGHRAVLLGIGTDQYENPCGLHWEEVFSHLYRHGKENPRAAFVGFYLGYDFNQWYRSLPERVAWELLTPGGKAARKPRYKGNPAAIPVRSSGWEFDMMGFKRLAVRPGVCECRNPVTQVKCEHEQNPWTYLCDAGAFFQMSFMKVIDPNNWVINDELTDWPCTEPVEGIGGQELYAKVLEGKERRSVAVLDDDMRFYNRVENVLLSRVMGSLARGFADIDINLRRNQWYGPGAAAAYWLRSKDAPKRVDLVKSVPEYWLALCKGSYYGGWFEIFSHGIIPGVSWNYDINNAYPYAIKNLPCMAHPGKNGRRKDSKPREKDGRYILVRARVTGSSNRIGPLPFRRKNGSILRPEQVEGWYWLDEIQASQRAGLVKTVNIKEWAWFDPCQCSKPFTDIQVMYDKRLAVGKNTSQGKAIKLTNNSDYGKFAQHVGSAPYGNWFYASRITANCRIQILDAIATHGNGAQSVLMVATDGISFDSPHPALPISKALGEWEETEYTDLTLFKPGVYWHRKGKDAILDAKTRGVPKAGLIDCIEQADQQFRSWQERQRFPGALVNGTQGTIRETLKIRTIYGWPYLDVPVNFRMTSCAQALNMGKWGQAGEVETDFYLRQNCDPHEKRYGQAWNETKSRLDSFVHTQTESVYSAPYGTAEYPEPTDWGYGLDGPVINEIAEVLGVLRDPNTQEWETVYDGTNRP
jgi:DNA polymerase type B, organellar and viral